MKKRYQPEDIESLLMEKSFFALYEEEKKFVLEHLASESEYEQMRETLLSIRGGAGNSGSEEIKPSPRIRAALMAEFDKKKKRGVIIWWNGIGYFFRDLLRFDLPIVRYGFAFVVLILGLFFIFRHPLSEKPNSDLAVVNPKQMTTVQPMALDITTTSKDSATSLTPGNTNGNGSSSDQVTNNSPRKKSNRLPAIIPQPKWDFGHDQQLIDSTKKDVSNDTVVSLASNAGSSNAFDSDGHDSLIVPSVTLANSNVVCAGTSSNIDGMSNVNLTYTWNASSPVYTNVTNNSIGTYSVLSINSNGNPSYVRTIDPSKVRSLSNDQNALSTFCELK